MKTRLIATTMLAFLLGTPTGQALAQLTPETPGTPQGLGFGASPAEPTSLIPTSAPPRVGLFTGFGDTLLDAGIDLRGIMFDHFLGNPGAGSVTGQTTNLFAFRPAVDFDLQRLVGIPGGNVHLGLTFFGLRSDVPQILTQAGGVMAGFQTTPATQTDIVSVLTYEERLLDGRLSVEAGRTNIYNYFLLSNSLDPFTHYSSTFQIVGDFNSIPYPVWGGRATYRFSPTWYVQAGAFEDNYRYAVNYGDRFGVNESTGAQILGEVGYRSEFANAAYPANMEVGFEWNTTRYGDFSNNQKGTAAPIIVPITSAAPYAGGGVIFAQGQQVVWRGASQPAGPPANIALYGAIDVSVDKPQPIDLDTLAGVNLTGLIPGRPLDALGVQFKYQRLSAIEQARETLVQRILARERGTQARDGYAVELVGNVQITPAIAIRPIVEYLIDPDNYYGPPIEGGGRLHRPRSGFEAGFFAVVSLGRLLGTSTKPF